MNRELNEKLEQCRRILEGEEMQEVSGGARKVQSAVGGEWEVMEDDELTVFVREADVGGVLYSLSVSFFDLDDTLGGGGSGEAFLSLSKEEATLAQKSYPFSDIASIKRIFQEAEKLWKSKVK